jgi:hypothetical protein
VAAEYDLFGPGKHRAFTPYLDPGERQQLHDLLRVSAPLPASFADDLRSLARRYVDDGDSLKLRAICLLVADLCEQGWRINIEGGRITFGPPGIARDGQQSVEDVKARVRHALQVARLRQLREPSVRQFLARMERRTARPAGRYSVLDLIDDGAALARELRRVSSLPEEDREQALAGVVDPVVEICEAGAKCPDTGLALIDIWRYFRHTWAHEYRAIPGRQMMVLVRNAARPRRPVMGIAMLASAVMRLTCRDTWIGWLRDAAQDRIRSGQWNPQAFSQALLDRIDTSIANIRWDDLVAPSEIERPSETVAFRLEQRAAGAVAARDAQLRAHFEAHREADGRVRPHRGEVESAGTDTDWLKASEDLLFVRKRSEGLAQLLSAKQTFSAAGLAENPAGALDALFESRTGQKALDIALAEFRKAGLSSEVADVSVCGAVHPYNQLLAGKLVTVLLTSREVRNGYAARYGGQISVIASQMAGRPVSKPAQLKILTTTSLYGVGSSQYNRLALPAKDHPDLAHEIRWSAIGQSLTGGFGTLHLGADTAQALRSMALKRHDARRVNNRFGEGTSPRLRQIREGLDALGLKSDAILHHASPRIFYGCELTPTSRLALLDLASSDDVASDCRSIAAAWRRRWLSKRILRPETLARLAELGPTSVRASLQADAEGQFTLELDEAKAAPLRGGLA